MIISVISVRSNRNTLHLERAARSTCRESPSAKGRTKGQKLRTSEKFEKSSKTLCHRGPFCSIEPRTLPNVTFQGHCCQERTSGQVHLFFGTEMANVVSLKAPRGGTPSATHSVATSPIAARTRKHRRSRQTSCGSARSRPFFARERPNDA